MPCGKKKSKHRKCERTKNDRCPDVVAKCSGPVAQTECDDPGRDEENGFLYRAGDKKSKCCMRVVQKAHGQNVLSFFLRSFFFRSIFGPLLRLFGGAPFWLGPALGTRRASRSNSSEEICETAPPSSAATTLSTEPSKNVSTRCRSAERRATSRGIAGK